MNFFEFLFDPKVVELLLTAIVCMAGGAAVATVIEWKWGDKFDR